MPDLFEYADTRGMVQRNGRRTSKKAARSAAKHKTTKRDIVLVFARMHPKGFADFHLVEMRPDWSESTARKRRTELTQENIILDTGRTMRKPSNGEEVTVWVHRDYVPNPPPIITRPEPGPTKKQLEAEIQRLQGILTKHGIGF